MAKKNAGVLGLDLLLDKKKSGKASSSRQKTSPQWLYLVGDNQFVNRHILSRLRKCIHSEEEDDSWAWREFLG